MFSFARSTLPGGTLTTRLAYVRSLDLSPIKLSTAERELLALRLRPSLPPPMAFVAQTVPSRVNALSDDEAPAGPNIISASF